MILYDWYYVLDEQGRPKSATLDEWTRWMVANPGPDARRVAWTDVGDGVEVSTVFLTTNYNFGDDGPPVLYETVVFGGPHNEKMWRWCTREQAAAGHDQIVAALRAGENPDPVVA